MTPLEILGAVLLLLGVVVTFIAAAGLKRFPNIYLRLHASTKATSGGALLVILGLLVYTFPSGSAFRLLLLLALILVATPVASQAIARAAHAHKTGRMLSFTAHDLDMGVDEGHETQDATRKRGSTVLAGRRDRTGRRNRVGGGHQGSREGLARHEGTKVQAGRIEPGRAEKEKSASIEDRTKPAEAEVAPLEEGGRWL